MEDGYIDEPQKPKETYIPEVNTLGVLKRTDEAFDGFTLFSSHKNTFLINNCGQLIRHWKSEYERGNAVYLLDDGSILRAGKIENPDISIGGIGGIIEHFDWNGNLKWSYTYSTAKYSHHHDFYPMPNGNILLLALEKKTKAEAIEAGRNPDLLEDDEIYTEQVIEISPEENAQASIVWRWDIWNHLIQDYNNTKLNYGDVKANPQLMDVNYTTIKGIPKKDWLHFNSIQYNETLDQIMLCSQALSEIYIIDHSTTIEEAMSHTGGKSQKGGDLLYRWGNPITFRTGTKENQQLFGPHYPNWINSNEILIFNNGLGRSESFSSVEIISTPIQGNSYKMPSLDNSFLPNKPSWTYINPIDKFEFYSKIISSAQRLPNGNTLVCEGTKGHFFEINGNQEIVWQYINPDSVNGVLTQGDNPTSNSVFRAIKYSPNHPAFNNKTLTPLDPIELLYNIGNCK